MQERIVWFLGIAAGTILLVAAVWQHSGTQIADDDGPGKPWTDRTATASAPPLTPSSPSAVRIQVEVLNGCGVPQVAARMTKRARRLGFDVIDEGNAESFAFLNSMVIDRRGDMDRARRVAAHLGIPHCIQQISDDPSRLAEVSIIIGRDYRRLELLE